MFKRVRDWHQARRERTQARKDIRRLSSGPAHTPSQVAEAVWNPPRHIRRAHKLAVRRMYRNRHLTMSSNQRQILAENIAAPSSLCEMELTNEGPVLADALQR